MKRFHTQLVFTIVFMLSAAGAHAAYISMDSHFSIHTGEDGIILELSTRNKGDEPAYAVQFDASLGKARVVSQTVPQLGVNQESRAEFKIKNTFALPGHYPVIIKTLYQDANSYRFSSLAVGFFDFQSPVISDIAIKSAKSDLPLQGSRKLNFTLLNNGSRAQNLTLELHVPNELAVEQGPKTATIGPREELTIAFRVKNFSALAKSNYAVFLVARYQDQDRHYSTSGAASIHIKPASTGLSPSRWLVITIVTTLILAVAFLLLRRK